MSEDNSTQQPFEEKTEPQKTKKPFLTPFRFGLGCGGLILLLILAFVGILSYFYFYVLQEEPLDFKMPEISQNAAQSATEKMDKLTAKNTEITLSEEEANAFFQEKILPELIEEGNAKSGKGLLTINDDNTVKLKLSLPESLSFPFSGEKYLNIDYEGEVSIKNGKLQLSKKPKKAVVGTLTDSSKKMLSFFNALNRDGSIIDKSFSITVENKQILIKPPEAETEKDKPEEKKQEDPPKESDESEVDKKADQVTDDPIDKPADDQVDKQADKQPDDPIDKPADEQVDKQADKQT